jgi:hypothetical protein
MTPRQQYAIQEKHREECVARAIAMMNFPLGLEALEGGYYLEMFQWLSRELVNGRTPTGVPAKKLVEWKTMGEFRRERGLNRTA